MENKETAVDFLIEHIKLDSMYEAKSIDEWKNVFIKAKAIEKEQIINAAHHGVDFENSPYKDAQEYYEKIYGKF